jgi:type IV pilus assembly protein PilB
MVKVATGWKLLGKILSDEMKVVTQDQLREALQRQALEPGRKLGEILIDMGVTSSEQITKALATQHSLPFVRLDQVEFSQEAIKTVLPAIAREHRIIPIKKNGNLLTIAMSDPLDMFAIENLKFVLNVDVECVLATREDIQEMIDRHYGKETRDQYSTVIEEASRTQTEIRLRTEAVTGTDMDVDDAPIIKYVQLMIMEAVRARASDIHIEPMDNRLRIRYRIDGILQEWESPPKRLQGSILSRVKIMADMDIAEKRKPQDGRIKVNTLGRELDIRVSAIPGVHGESIVMRLLDRQHGLISLEELGFHPSDYRRFKSIIKRPNGIILVTGPTGSGKTTTLYAALKELNRPDVKIVTAENPVEYNIEGINQSQVNVKAGLTFARILRAMLRQAPNIILVGEIRDTETAEIAIQAALTGHLVFSTLHTNDAAGALTRLIDMRVKPFLVASSIQAVMAQRLVRVLCNICKEPDNPDPSLLSAVGLQPRELEGRTVYKAVGCPDCRYTGYRGRKGIFELMELDSTLRDMVFHKEPANRIQEVARLKGMVTLLEDGVRKMLDGVTSLTEVITITRREDITY